MTEYKEIPIVAAQKDYERQRIERKQQIALRLVEARAKRAAKLIVNNEGSE